MTKTTSASWSLHEKFISGKTVVIRSYLIVRRRKESYVLPVEKIEDGMWFYSSALKIEDRQVIHSSEPNYQRAPHNLRRRSLPASNHLFRLPPCRRWSELRLFEPNTKDRGFFVILSRRSKIEDRIEVLRHCLSAREYRRWEMQERWRFVISP